MLRDFREQLRAELPDPAVVEGLLRDGELAKALKADRTTAMHVLNRTEVWESCVLRMTQRCRAGELLSFVYANGLTGMVSVDRLLRRMYECRDHAGFLKQAERFNVGREFAAEIDGAIAELERKGQIPQAIAYRKSFAR